MYNSDNVHYLKYTCHCKLQVVV